MKFYDVIILVDPKFRSFHIRSSKFWVIFDSFFLCKKFQILYCLYFYASLQSFVAYKIFIRFWYFCRVIKTLLTIPQSKGDVIMTSSIRHPSYGCKIFISYKLDTHLYICTFSNFVETFFRLEKFSQIENCQIWARIRIFVMKWSRILV